jgi:DNA-binding NarL/FixJ family response regulator
VYVPGARALADAEAASSLRDRALGREILSMFPVSPEHQHYQDLLKSIGEFGYNPAYPIVEDEQEGVIDGRTRLAVAEHLGIAGEVTRRVVRLTGSEFLNEVVEANLYRRQMTKAEMNRVTKHLENGSASGRELAKRLRERDSKLRNAHVIRLALEADEEGFAAHTQQQIADLTGVSQSEVQRVLAGQEFTRAGKLPPQRTGRPRAGATKTKTPPNAPPVEDLVPKVVDLLEQGLTQTEIGEELGLRDNSMTLAKAVGRAEERMANTSPPKQAGAVELVCNHSCPVHCK